MSVNEVLRAIMTTKKYELTLNGENYGNGELRYCYFSYIYMYIYILSLL
jgi:hypothetical protein